MKYILEAADKVKKLSEKKLNEKAAIATNETIKKVTKDADSKVKNPGKVFRSQKKLMKKFNNLKNHKNSKKLYNSIYKHRRAIKNVGEFGLSTAHLLTGNKAFAIAGNALRMSMFQDLTTNKADKSDIKKLEKKVDKINDKSDKSDKSDK